MSKTKQNAVTHSLHKKVPLSKLAGKPSNPSSRTEVASLADLTQSMAEYGLFCPIMVNEGWGIEDGHRRYQTAMNLGWTHVPVIMIHSPYSNDVGYERMNDDRKAIEGFQSLQLYLAGGPVPNEGHHDLIVHIEQEYGRDLLVDMEAAKLGPRSYTVANRFAKYAVRQGVIEKEDVKDITEKTIYWIIDPGKGARLEDAMRERVPAREILDCILAGKPFELTNPTRELVAA